jgi:type IV secretory pathway VirB9-like protein
MNPTNVSFLILLSGGLVMAPAAVKESAAKPTGDTVATKTSPQTALPEVEPGAKVVRYGEKDIVRVRTKLRYSTLIVLPKSEQILDFTSGDKELWKVDGAQNFAYVKPTQVASQTNLNLITASGNVYSFVLAEISEVPKAEPDLKVFVEAKEESMVSAATGTPRFVSAAELEDYRRQMELAKEETRQVKQAAQAAIDSGISKFITNVRFPYRFEAGKKPFMLRAMYHDDKFTYIQARPEETPTLYELKDGKPNLVNFAYKNGVYVVTKILEQGYLAIGKQKLGFMRQD